MSRTATNWAWGLQIKPATLKLILLALADRADENHCCFPGISRLEKDTSLDKKTIQSGINALIEKGVITDTGIRKGITRRIRVLRLAIQATEPNEPNNGHIAEASAIPNCDKPSNGKGYSPYPNRHKTNTPKNGNIPENGMLNDPEIGKLNDPENGIQNLSVNQSIEPTDPPIPPSPKKSRFNPKAISLPKWLTADLWGEWVDYRRALGKPIRTWQGATGMINKLTEFMSQQIPPGDVIRHSIACEYQGLYPPRKSDGFNWRGAGISAPDIAIPTGFRG